MTTAAALNHPFQRAAWSAAVAHINQSHLEFWCEHTSTDSAPFRKLSNKVQSWLRGELKSLANLERFQQAFAEWRQAVPEEDNLGYRISELCCAALYSAAEAILDPDCDDLPLITGNIDDLYREMSELSDQTQELQSYWQEVNEALLQILEGAEQPPLSRDFFELLKELDTSLFGL